MNFKAQQTRDLKEWIDRHDLDTQEEDILFLIYDAVDNSMGAIIITDLEGRIIYVNKSFLEIFGADRDTCINTPIASLFVTPPTTNFPLLIESVEENSQCQMRRSDNSCFYALTITSKVQNLQGDWSRQIFSFIDMTTQKELEELQKVLIKKLEKSQKELSLLTEKLEQLSLQDALTGLANRRSFDISLDLEWHRACRYNTPLSLLMIDVDNFKMYNDRYGHQKGDHCLKRIATAMKESHVTKRAGDIIARYGGEEFVVILPGTNNEAAFSLAKSIVENVRKQEITHIDNEAGVATISIGVATVYDYRNCTKEALIEEADKALYTAKGDGKSCVR